MKRLSLVAIATSLVTAVSAAPDTASDKYWPQWRGPLPNVLASPVGAKGRVYIAGQEGTTLVIKQGPAFEVLAKNPLDDGFDASPALVDSELYLRGFTYLYSIGK